MATSVSANTNDTIANGTASIIIASVPAHGTATVDGGSITYTPTRGNFGNLFTSTLSVRNESATSTLSLAGAAKVTLSGTVHDGAMPGAQLAVCAVSDRRNQATSESA